MPSRKQKHSTIYEQTPIAENAFSTQGPSKKRRTLRSNAQGPRSAVLELPELLEHIFSFLPKREVFAKAQRVCRLWNNVIAKSPTVQYRLCFNQSANQASVPVGHSGDSPLVIVSHNRRDVSKLNCDPNIPVYEKGVSPNHLLQPFDARREVGHIPAQLRTMAIVPDEESEFTTLAKQLVVQSCQLHLPLNFKPQTWHGMYLTEPRSTIAHIRVYPSAPSERMDLNAMIDSWTTASVRDADGLTFGSILDVAKKICQTVVPRRARCRYKADITVTIITET